MTEIAVTYPVYTVNERRIGMRLYMMFLGPQRRLLIVLAFVAPWLIGAVLLHNFTGLNMWRDEVVASILLIYLSIFCWMMMTSRLLKSADDVVDATPDRQQTRTWTLNAAGVTDGDIRFDWSEFTALHYFQKTTVLVVHMRRVVALPDAALPDGLTPDALQAQIKEWSGL